jgi:hypothetical protein
LVPVVSVPRTRGDLVVVWVVLEARVDPVVQAHAVPCTPRVPIPVDLLPVVRAHVLDLLVLVAVPALLVLVAALALADLGPADLAAW